MLGGSHKNMYWGRGFTKSSQEEAAGGGCHWMPSLNNDALHTRLRHGVAATPCGFSLLPEVGVQELWYYLPGREGYHLPKPRCGWNCELDRDREAAARPGSWECQGRRVVARAALRQEGSNRSPRLRLTRGSSASALPSSCLGSLSQSVSR